MQRLLIALSFAAVLCGQRIEVLLPEAAEHLAVDAAGNRVVARSVTEPGAPGRRIRVQRSNADTVAFDVTFGGTGDSDLSALRIASNGDILLLGTTNSPDFPAFPSALWNRTTPPPNLASFFVRLDAEGHIRTSTFLAADGFSLRARSLALDPADSVFIGAELRGSGPLRFGDRIVPGNGTLLVLKIDPSASTALALRLGGSSPCEATLAGLEADSHGGLFLAGTTCADDFSTTLGAYLMRRPGGDCVAPGSFPTLFPCSSGLLARLDASDLRVAAATYLGGTAASSIRGLALDPSGSPYVTGTAIIFPANSPNTFPTTPGAFQETVPLRLSVIRPESVFVTKLKPDLSALVFSTFLTGSRSESPSSLRVDPQSRPIVAGGTYSRDFPATGAFRTPCGPDPGLNPPERGFVTRLDSEGRHLTASVLLPEGPARIAFLNLDRFPVITAGGSLIELDFDSADRPSVACAVNGANFRSEPFVAPGQILTFFGAGFSPGTKVVFERLVEPAPILYASSTQINVVVPPQVAGLNVATALICSPSGILSNRRSFLVRPTNPSVKLFVTSDGMLIDRGSPLADVRLANGSLNSLENPIPRLAPVSIFTTGLDLSLDLRVQIGGDPAELLDAVLLPGTFGSVQWLTFQVPAGGAGGLRTITVVNGDQTTPANSSFLWVE